MIVKNIHIFSFFNGFKEKNIMWEINYTYVIIK